MERTKRYARRREQNYQPFQPPLETQSPLASFFREETPEERAARLYKARQKRKRKQAKSNTGALILLAAIVLFIPVETEYKEVLLFGLFVLWSVPVAVEAFKHMDGFFVSLVFVGIAILAIVTFLPQLLGMSEIEAMEYAMGHHERAYSIVEEHGKFPFGVVVGLAAALLFTTRKHRDGDDNE